MAKSVLAEKKNGLFTHGSIKSALNQWKDATVITWKPFDKLGLDSAPVAMEWNDRRLLLEDFMMLQPGNEVKCFITKKHPLIAKKGPMTKIIAATIEHEPYHPVQFGRNLYFVMKLSTVRSNKNFNDFKDGVLDESEMVDRCGRQQGHGIVFDFVTTFGKSGRANSPQCIYFSNLIEHPMSIMFWKNNHHEHALYLLCK